jgi:NADH-quinone oxidoreductase subunit F
VIDRVGGGPDPGHRVVAALSGVANPLLPELLLDTPVSYEAMSAVGSGLGAAGFLVFDDTTDLAAVAHGVSRFLAVESCGQCEPCKQDGLALAELLDGVRRSAADEHDLDEIADRVRTVSVEARCFLAVQHELVIGSVLKLFPDELRAHVTGARPAVPPEPIVPIVDIVDGRAVLDEDELRKQPDWTYDETDSGASPADRIDERMNEAVAAAYGSRRDS